MSSCINWEQYEHADEPLPHTQSTKTLWSLTAQYLFNNIQINFSLHIRLILGFYIYLALTFVHLFTKFKISLSIYTTSIVQCYHILQQLPLKHVDLIRHWSSAFISYTDRCLWATEQQTDRRVNMHQKFKCGFSLRMTAWVVSPRRDVHRSVAPQPV